MCQFLLLTGTFALLLSITVATDVSRGQNSHLSEGDSELLTQEEAIMTHGTTQASSYRRQLIFTSIFVLFTVMAVGYAVVQGYKKIPGDRRIGDRTPQQPTLPVEEQYHVSLRLQ